MILATRGSALAVAQAELVRQKLEAAGASVTILPVTTKGDRDRNRPLTEIGGDGLFIRELEKVLLSGEADLAVHSGKDLPFRLAERVVRLNTGDWIRRQNLPGSGAISIPGSND